MIFTPSPTVAEMVATGVLITIGLLVLWFILEGCWLAWRDRR